MKPLELSPRHEDEVPRMKRKVHKVPTIGGGPMHWTSKKGIPKGFLGSVWPFPEVVHFAEDGGKYELETKRVAGGHTTYLYRWVATS